MRLARSLDHVAFLTWDTKATHDFYVDVMGWPLVVAWGRDDGDPPFFITGYDTGSWVIEFEEMVGLPRAATSATRTASRSRSSVRAGRHVRGARPEVAREPRRLAQPLTFVRSRT